VKKIDPELLIKSSKQEMERLLQTSKSYV